MPLNQRMDKENVVHFTMKYYSAVEYNDILKIEGKWNEIGKTILREVTQTKKGKIKSYVLTQKWVLDTKQRITSL